MFIDKLNKKQEGVYVLEEEKIIVDGKWEGYLDHDNVESNSIYIYTEEKFGGDKVENYFISTSAEMPWKLYLKVFSKSEKIYITYESAGDQIEAEDVNLVQDAITLQNAKVTSLVAETLRLENAKANLTYVDTELLKKYDKDKVYTKEEVEQLIDDLIGGSPEALDTLREIADALNNDPNFAATMTTELSKKVDKVIGKSLSDENYTLAEKEKLAEVEDKANNYIHPLTHSANMIEENINKRFVSDAEKKKWNDMEAGDMSDLAGVGRTTETVKDNSDKIGTLPTLKTNNKTNVVGAVNELFQNVSSGKNLIATAITDKGVPTSGSDTFNKMAVNIGGITTGMPIPLNLGEDIVIPGANNIVRERHIYMEDGKIVVFARTTPTGSDYVVLIYNLKGTLLKKIRDAIISGGTNNRGRFTAGFESFGLDITEGGSNNGNVSIYNLDGTIINTGAYEPALTMKSGFYYRRGNSSTTGIYNANHTKIHSLAYGHGMMYRHRKGLLLGYQSDNAYTYIELDNSHTSFIIMDSLSYYPM